MTEVAAEAPGRADRGAVRPNFAGEVARNLPAAVTLACADEALG
jgi:glycerol-3-phosphate dehydrogenase (NAD(P)+)